MNAEQIEDWLPQLHKNIPECYNSCRENPTNSGNQY